MATEHTALPFYIEWKRERVFENFLAHKDNNARLKEHFDDMELPSYKLDTYKRRQFDQGIEFLFDKASGEGCSDCPSCQHNEATEDAFGTGDSPTLFECSNQEPIECPHAEEQILVWLD